MSHLSDLQIDDQLMRAERPAHLDGCERCRLRWEELSRDRAEFAARARPAAFADAVLARRRPRRFLRWWMLAPALAALLVMMIWPHEGERWKGAPVAVELFVKSGGKTARWEVEHRYRSGDVLQPVYTSAQPLYLTAVDVEQGSGRVSILTRDPAPLPAGTRRRLDRSFVLDDSSGDERIFFLFSQQPLEVNAVLEAARSGHDSLSLPVAAQASFLIRR